MLSSIGGSPGFGSVAFSQLREKLFAKLDTNADGSVDKTEFTTTSGTSSSGSSKAEELFGKIDSDGDGSISRAESDAFLKKLDDQMQAAMLQMQEVGGGKGMGHGKPPSPEEMFGKLDSNSDGYIDADEIEAGPKPGDASTDDMLAHFDADGDGKISEDEFLEAGPPEGAGPPPPPPPGLGSAGGEESGTTLLELLSQADEADTSKKAASVQQAMMNYLLKLQETSLAA